jgi:glycosyltransferase involved in cell wall biosynthesis
MMQTLLPKEVIVIDDCSLDNSVKIIRRLANEFSCIRLIELKKNLGVSHARNVGLQKAKTAYVTTVDSDDFIYDNEKYATEMELIYNSVSENVISYSGIVKVDIQDNMLIKMDLEKYPKGNIMEYLLLQKIHYIPRDCCIRRQDIIDAGGYNESMNLYEDMDLLYRLAVKNEFLFSGRYGIAYRRVTDGLSRQSRKKHERVLDKLFWKYCIFAESPLKKTKIILLRHMYIYMNKTRDTVKKLLERGGDNAGGNCYPDDNC